MPRSLISLLFFLNMHSLGAPLADKVTNSSIVADQVDGKQTSNIIMQKFEASCGLAALATILHYQYGHDVSETSLLLELDLLPPDEKRITEGLTLRDVAQLARNHGLSAVWKKTSIKGLEKITKNEPIIIRYLLNTYSPHFSVLKKNGFNGDFVYLADPAYGNIKLTRDELIDRWNLPGSEQGYVLILKPLKSDSLSQPKLLDGSNEQGVSYLDLSTALSRNSLFPKENKWISRVSIEKSILANSFFSVPGTGAYVIKSGGAYNSVIDLTYGISKITSININGSFSKFKKNTSDSYVDYFGDIYSSSFSEAGTQFSGLSVGLSRAVYIEESNTPGLSISGNIKLPSNSVRYGYDFTSAVNKNIYGSLSIFSSVGASLYSRVVPIDSLAQSKMTNVSYSLGGSATLIKKWDIVLQLQAQRNLSWSPHISKNLSYFSGLTFPVSRNLSIAPYYSRTPNVSRAFGLTIASSF